MNPRADFRQRAMDDIHEIADFIARDNLSAARRFYDAVESDAVKLASFPGIGRLREFPNPALGGMRSSILSGYPNHIIFYQPIDNGISIVRVLHGARDIDAIFSAM